LRECPTRKKSRDGNAEYATYGVGVNDGKDRTSFFPVVVFGDYSDTVAKYVTKGWEVLVSGRVRIDEDDRFNVVADTVRFGYDPRRGNEPD